MKDTTDAKQGIHASGEESQSGTSCPPLKRHYPISESEVSLTAHEILPDGSLDDCQVEDAIRKVHESTSSINSALSSNGESSTSAPRCSFWVDVEISSQNDLPLLARHESQLFNTLTPFLKRHLLQPSQLEIPQTLVLPQSALIVLRVLPSDSDSNVMRHAAAICLKGLLITITTAKNAVDTQEILRSSTRRNLFESSWRHMMDLSLTEASTTGALGMWLYVHLTHVSAALNRIRVTSLNLCEQIDRDPHDVDLSEIVSLRNALLRLTAVAEEQEEVLQSLYEGQAITHTLDFTVSLKSYFKAMRATSGATERTAGRLDTRLAHARAMYDSIQQDRINRRLSTLTIVSAVFLPLSLMAGIWGMNFVDIPGLEQENGFYYALASMVGVALVLLVAFWKLGWFI